MKLCWTAPNKNDFLNSKDNYDLIQVYNPQENKEPFYNNSLSNKDIMRIKS